MQSSYKKVENGDIWGKILESLPCRRLRWDKLDVTLIVAKAWLTSPTYLMWDLSNLLKCPFIKYLWQLLGIVHMRSQIIRIIIVVNLVVCQQPAVS